MSDLQRLKDALSQELCNITFAEAYEKGICIQCKQFAIPKCYSKAGRKEYRISGLCEQCFDRNCADFT